MRFNRSAAIVLRQYYLIRGSAARLMPLFIWVAIDMLLWGFITRYLNMVASPGFNFVPVMLGAALLEGFFVRVMHGVTMTFFEDVWSRNFLNVFASPLLISEYLAGLAFSSIATSSVGLAVMILLASTVFGLSFYTYGAAVLAFLLVLFLFGIALGIFGTSIVLRLGPAAEWFIWPIPAIISPFACVFYPLSTLPRWMQYVSYVLPPSYVFESMRAIVFGGAFSAGKLVIGGCLAVVDIFLACWFFARVYHHAVRSGLIARYSAESVS